MKNIFKKFVCGVVTALGVSVGMDMYKKLKNPVTRVELKKRFIKVKDAILGEKEES